MRKDISYITVGKILERLHNDGLKIARNTFYQMEKDGVFISNRAKRGWRTYTSQEAEIIIQLIKENYGLTERTDQPTESVSETTEESNVAV